MADEKYNVIGETPDGHLIVEVVKVPAISAASILLLVVIFLSASNAGQMVSAVLSAMLCGIGFSLIPILILSLLGKGSAVKYILIILAISGIIFVTNTLPAAQTNADSTNHSVSSINRKGSESGAYTLQNATEAQAAIYMNEVSKNNPEATVNGMDSEKAKSVLRQNGIPLFGPYSSNSGSVISITPTVIESEYINSQLNATLRSEDPSQSADSGAVIYLNHSIIWGANGDYSITDYDLSADRLSLTVHWNTGDITYVSESGSLAV